MTDYAALDVFVIANPAAGDDEPVIAALGDVFGGAGLTWQMAVTNEAGDAERLAGEAAAAGVKLIASYGGDGTTREVASALVGTGVPMAILPGGTGNVFGKELGVPQDLRAAAELVTLARHTRTVDVGEASVDGGPWRRFVLRAAAGLEADVIADTTREQKDKMGFLAYVSTSIKSLTSLPVAHWTMTVDGETVEADGVTGVVTNISRAGFAEVTYSSTIDVSDGKLDGLIFTAEGLAGLAGLAADLAGSGDSERVMQRPGAVFKIDADPPQRVILDGDEFGTTPLSVRTLPAALDVLVPAPAAEPASANAEDLPASKKQDA